MKSWSVRFLHPSNRVLNDVLISYENVNFEHFWGAERAPFLVHFWAGNWPKTGSRPAPLWGGWWLANVTIVSPTGHRPARRGALLGPKTGPKRGHFGGPFSVHSMDSGGGPIQRIPVGFWRLSPFGSVLSFWDISSFLGSPHSYLGLQAGLHWIHSPSIYGGRYIHSRSNDQSIDNPLLILPIQLQSIYNPFTPHLAIVIWILLTVDLHVIHQSLRNRFTNPSTVHLQSIHNSFTIPFTFGAKSIHQSINNPFTIIHQSIYNPVTIHIQSIDKSIHTPLTIRAPSTHHSTSIAFNIPFTKLICNPSTNPFTVHLPFRSQCIYSQSDNPSTFTLQPN